MALAINQLLNYSWMSQASYLDFSGLSFGASGTDLASTLKDRNGINPEKILSDTQATQFTAPATGYSFINTHPNDHTGFSATVFKSNADNTYTIAVRGTEQ